MGIVSRGGFWGLGRASITRTSRSTSTGEMGDEDEDKDDDEDDEVFWGQDEQDERDSNVIVYIL